jgi:hypothetical protein
MLKEALEAYRKSWEMWLSLKHTTENEKELARTKIRLIDVELELLTLSPSK